LIDQVIGHAREKNKHREGFTKFDILLLAHQVIQEQPLDQDLLDHNTHWLRIKVLILDVQGKPEDGWKPRRTSASKKKHAGSDEDDGGGFGEEGHGVARVVGQTKEWSASSIYSRNGGETQTEWWLASGVFADVVLATSPSSSCRGCLQQHGWRGFGDSAANGNGTLNHHVLEVGDG
jgi:hypothetical protein